MYKTMIKPTEIYDASFSKSQIIDDGYYCDFYKQLIDDILKYNIINVEFEVCLTTAFNTLYFHCDSKEDVESLQRLNLEPNFLNKKGDFISTNACFFKGFIETPDSYITIIDKYQGSDGYQFVEFPKNKFNNI